MTIARSTQVFIEIARQGDNLTRSSQIYGQLAYGPPASKFADTTQALMQIAYSGEGSDMTANTSQLLAQIAYFEGQPAIDRQAAWTFVLDGHRFYVLPLGPQGTWAYDTTTHEWCQLQTDGFDGINFEHGCMWGIRIMGGDSLYTYLLELDPTQSFDDAWREVEHMVTGGIATRSRSGISVANVTLTASVGEDASIESPISLAYSDDNGATWSREFDIPLTDVSTQTLIWNALGTFSAPGRVFRFTDFAGPVRLDGADVILTDGSGNDNDKYEQT